MCSLADSALPTGGFVASSGLESYVQHGFVQTSSQGIQQSGASGSTTVANATSTLTDFVRQSLISYAQLNLPFFERAHHAANSATSDTLATACTDIIDCDARLEQMVLNHVTRRASKAQGVALLMLYGRAFAVPHSNAKQDESTTNAIPADRARHIIMTRLVDNLKTASRQTSSNFGGHLPICFAVLTAALGLSLSTRRPCSFGTSADLAIARSVHLHLFLQARALLSSAVRMNLTGPYAAQRLLLTEVKPIVAAAMQSWSARATPSLPNAQPGSFDSDDEDGPATTWPLGEILAGRHDQLHSRIFNS